MQTRLRSPIVRIPELSQLGIETCGEASMSAAMMGADSVMKLRSSAVITPLAA
jgi:hypothetical protein